MKHPISLFFNFVNEIQDFRPSLEKTDPFWEILFPDEKDNWHHIYVSLYNNIFLISQPNSENEDLEVIPTISVKVKQYLKEPDTRTLYEDEMEEWYLVIQAALKWLKELEKNWFKSNLKLQTEYPFDLRYGTIDFGILTHLVPDIKGIRQSLGKEQTDKILTILKDDLIPFKKQLVMASMTVSRYLEYCRIAYTAFKDSLDGNLSDKELYRLYADGRHEGLLDIDPDSEEEFANWLDHKHPKRQRGGHPWEIVRGGSYNHIGLRVMRPSFSNKDEYTIELYGFSESRAAKYLNIYLAIRKANLPIKLNQAKKIQKLLLEQYRVGIIPSYQSARLGDEFFPIEEDVLNILFFEEIEQYKSQLLPFIRWKHFPLLRNY